MRGKSDFMKLSGRYMSLPIINVVAKRRICENSNYSCVWRYTVIYFIPYMKLYALSTGV